MAKTLFDTILGAVQSELSSYGAAATDFAAPWLKRFLLNGIPIMKETADRHLGCELPNVVPPGVTEPCRDVACLSCAACGKSTCLAHAFVSFRAEAICWLCVASAAQTTRRTGVPPFAAPPHAPREAQEPPRRRSATPPGVSPELVARVKAAYVVLGVEPGERWSEIRSRHKRLSLKYHPDRWQQESKRAQREAAETFRSVQEAMQALEEYREKKAAA